MKKVGVAVAAILLAACSGVHYKPGYIKDGEREGYEDDFAACESANPDSVPGRDGCMEDRGWVRSDTIKVERD